MQRHFYKCCDCLSVIANDSDSRFASPNAVCGLCASKLIHMGRVVEQGLVRDSLECPCDLRCTHARGPKCDCSCGGRNHGSQAVVHIVRDAGGIPVAQTPYSGKAEQIAAEWRAAYADIMAIIQPMRERKSSQWVPSSEFNELLRLESLRRKARKSTNHKNRLRILADATAIGGVRC